jgi:hypothetical protein
LIEARAADGSVHRFPDDTPVEVVDRAMQTYATERQRAGQARADNSGVLGYIGGAGRQALQGFGFGLGDEVLAGIQTGAGLWGDYGQALAGERARNADFRDQNPAMATALNIGGAVALPLGALGRGAAAVGGMIAPAGVGAGIAERLARSTISRGALAGATGGALAGAGEGEGVEGRLTGAAQGAALGTIGGAALGAGVSAISGVGERVLNAAGLRNPETATDRHLLRALERDGINPATLRNPPQGPGLAPPVEGMALVDRGGANTRTLAAVAANRPGETMSAADVLMEARREARPERMAAAVDASLGGGGGTRYADELATLRQTQQANAAPRYASAFSRIRPDANEAARLMPAVDDPIGQDALQRGLRVIELENTAARLRDPSTPVFDPAQYGVARGPDGQFVLTDGFRNMRLYDAVKRGFDEIVEGFRDPVTLRLNLNQYGRAVNDARAAYVGQLREMYPRYGSALNAYAGPAQTMDAMAQGRAALDTNPDQVRAIAARLSPSDLSFFQLGVGRAITDLASDPQKGPGAARRLLEDRNMQRRLDAAIPDPAQRALFASALQREVEMAAVERAVSPRANSHTGRLAAGADDMANDPPGGTLIALLNAARHGGAPGAGASALTSLYRRTQGIHGATADALSSRLLNTDATANAATIDRLMERRRVDLEAALRRARFGSTAMRGIGSAGALEAQDY